MWKDFFFFVAVAVCRVCCSRAVSCMGLLFMVFEW